MVGGLCRINMLNFTTFKLLNIVILLLKQVTYWKAGDKNEINLFGFSSSYNGRKFWRLNRNENHGNSLYFPRIPFYKPVFHGSILLVRN